MSNNLPASPDNGGTREPIPVTGPAAMYRPPQSDAPPTGSFRLLWRRVSGSIWRYKWLALLLVASGTGLGFYVSRALVTPAYLSNATLWVDGYRAAEEDGPFQPSKLLSSGGWIELVRSYTVLDPVVRDLRLYLTPRNPADSTVFASFQANARVRPAEYRFDVDRGGEAFTLSVADGTVVQQGRAGEEVGGPVGFRWLPPREAYVPGRQIAFQVQAPPQVAKTLSEQLEIKSRDNGNFLVLELGGPDPVRISETLNAIIDRFVVVAGELKASQSRELTEILQEQLASAAQNLQSSEASLQGFRVGTVTLPSERVIQQAPGLQATQGSVFSNFFDLKLEREQLRRDRENILVALDSNSGPLSVAALEVVPSVRAATELTRALADLATKRAELRTLRAQFTDQYLPVQRLAESVESLERQSIPQLASMLVAEIRDREADLDARLSSASTELRQIPERSIEEARLERTVTIAAELYRLLRERYETARLAAVSAVPDVQVLDYARVPESAENESEWFQMFMMFLMGSLALAVAVPVMIDRVDTRLRYPEQVTDELGLPILGAVPHVAPVRGKLGTGRETNAGAVEALREIRLNVMHAFGSAGPLLATITSPGVGDGKSFLASNLALSFADFGHRTLIIDGDIRRGQLHRLLGSSRVPGLTDFLSGDATLEEVVQPTAYTGLDLVACGTRLQAGPELLGSSAMSSLIRDLRSRYDVILIDSSPLGAGVDPFILSTLTGNTLLVLRNGRTDREFALAKLELLDRLPVRLLGAVLNDVPASGAYRYYSYVAGYEAESERVGGSGARQLQEA
jgi:polysaccharide biosynthesis transport protein